MGDDTCKQQLQQGVNMQIYKGLIQLNAKQTNKPIKKWAVEFRPGDWMVKALSHIPKGVHWIPSQGTSLDCKFDPQ